MACWRTKAAISLTHIKIEEKLLWRAYRNSPALFRTVPFPTSYGPLFPKIGGSQLHPKLQSLLSQERVKLRTSNLADTFKGPLEQKPVKNFGEKGAWAYPGTDEIFWVPPFISGTGKATNFNFCKHIHRIDRNKRPLKFREK